MTDKVKKISDKKARWIYSGIFLAILFVYIFCTVILPLMLHEHTLEKTEAVASTCWECGNLEYWSCTDCGRVYEDESAKISTRVWKMSTERLVHDFDDATCTVAKTCRLCKYTDGDSLGHDFEQPEYVWSNDMTECTATRICKRDSSHIETETAKSVLTEEGYYSVEFVNSSFGTSKVYDLENNGYENKYEGEKLPTVIGDGGNSFRLDKIGTIVYPSSDTAKDFDIAYIQGVKYRFVGMSNGTIRIYTGDDYENYTEIGHTGQHNYIDVSPVAIESMGGKVLFTGYDAKLEWFVCDTKMLTSEACEYQNYCLYFDRNTIGRYATPYIDFENNILYWYGYTTDSSDISDSNKMIITAWDVSGLDFKDPRNAQVKLISKTTADYFGAIQGGKCFGGDLYIGSANPESPYESRLLRLDPATGAIKSKLVFNSINVIKGISYVIQDNVIKWYISDWYDIYNVIIKR